MSLLNRIESGIKWAVKLREATKQKPGSMTLNQSPQGTSGTEIFGGFFDEDFLQELANGSNTMDIWDKIMRSDGQVKMLLSARKNPILQANWFVEPGELEDDEVAQKHADLIKYELFERSQKPFKELLEEILTFIEKGFAIFERVHLPIKNDPNFGTYIGYQKIAWRSQRTIEEWELEKDGSIKRVRQTAEGDLETEGEGWLDGRFLIVFSLDKHGDNYEGISALRPIYGNYIRKRMYQKLMAIGIERYAVGTPKGTIPTGKENTPEAAAFQQVLQSFTSHQSSYVTLPEGWTVDMFDSNFDADTVRKAISAENLEMAKAFVAQHLELGTGDNGGAYALATDLSDQFLSIIQNDADIVARQLNCTYVKELINLNFGPQKAYPKIRVTGINDKLGKEFAQIASILTNAKILTPTRNLEIFAREQFKMPALTEQEEEATPEIREIGDGGAGALFTEKKYEETKLDAILPFTVIGFQEGEAVQSIVFDKKLFSREQAIAWAIKNKFKADQINESEEAYILGQIVPDKFESLRTVKDGLPEGVSFVVGKPKGPSDDDESTDLGPEHGGSISSPESLFGEVQLAEPSKTEQELKRMLEKNTTELKGIIRSNLKRIGEDMINRMINEIKVLPQSQWRKPARTISARGTKQFNDELLLFFAQLALRTTTQTKREIPGGSKAKFTELKLKDLQLGEAEDAVKKLLPKAKEVVRTETLLILESQVGDLEKNIKFSLNSSADSTDSPSLIQKDLTDQAENYASGPAVSTAAGNASAVVMNQVRDEIFSLPEFKDRFVGFRFQNSNPKSPICKDLNGRVFDINDPSSQRFRPPLHHNCKSFTVPLIKLRQGEEVTDLVPTRRSLEKFITL